MRFKGLNLNLLVALDALLMDRSVSAAGRRLFLTQSATSSALAQLRAHFNDPLLVRTGNQLVRTALGEQLVAPVKDALRMIETVMEADGTFVPASSQRNFAVSSSDYVAQTLMAKVVARLADEAPNISLDLLPPEIGRVGALEQGEIDLFITPDLFIAANHPTELLFADDHVVVGCARNPALAKELTLETFSALGHVSVRFGRERLPSFVEREMNRLGIVRRLELVTPSFTLVPRLTIGTSRIAVVPRRLAIACARELPLAIHPLPVTLPSLHQVLQYHRNRAGDEGLRWLRQVIIDMAREPEDTPSEKSI